jgi:hypothetical protein
MGCSEESVFLAKEAFKFLQSNLGNCYHKPPVRGAIYSEASG